jgi:PAS domain S-box-containing protein
MDRRTQPLNVLMVEDSPADAELILRAMRDLGIPIEHRRVSNEFALRAALDDVRPDIILSDFSMPGFSGQEALRIAKALVPDTPFLFVSGTIGEELAIEALKLGAEDYVLKDNLRRLPSAMDRAIRAADERAERVRISAALHESEERFRSIVESSLDWIWEIDRDGTIVYSNEAVRDILGYTAQDVIGRSMLALMAPTTRAAVEALIPQYLVGSGRWRRRSMTFLHRDGSERMLISNARSVHDDGTTVLASAARITTIRNGSRRIERFASSCASIRCSAPSVRRCCVPATGNRSWTARAKSRSIKVGSAQPSSWSATTSTCASSRDAAHPKRSPRSRTTSRCRWKSPTTCAPTIPASARSVRGARCRCRTWLIRTCPKACDKPCATQVCARRSPCRSARRLGARS